MFTPNNDDKSAMATKAEAPTEQHTSADDVQDSTVSSSEPRRHSAAPSELAYSPTSTQSTQVDTVESPVSGHDVEKPHVQIGEAPADSCEAPESVPAQRFSAVHACLQKSGAMKIPFVERTWARMVRSGGTASHTWKTTLLQVGPLSGIFCLVLAATTMVASLGILLGSNGQPVDTWSAPPSTYLAIFTAVGNLGMWYACLQGVVVAWWISALRGSNLAKLHHDWQAGTTLRGALSAGKHMGWLGLACICSSLVLVDGPLLQRSSTVISAPIVGRRVNLNVSMTPEIPTGYTGFWQPPVEDLNVVGWSPQFNATMPTATGEISNLRNAGMNHSLEAQLGAALFSKKPLFDAFQGCAGSCKAKLIAPALTAQTCTTHRLPVNYSAPAVSNASNIAYGAVPLRSNVYFVANGLDVDGEKEAVVLLTGFAAPVDCVGVLQYTACNLVAAIGEYDVSIEGNLATLDDAAHPVILDIANNTKVNRTDTGQGDHESTLAGIVTMHAENSVASVSLLPIDGAPQAVLINRRTIDQYLYNAEDQCPSFRNPQDDMLGELNQIMVYAGLFASREDQAFLSARMDAGLKVRSQTVGQVTGTETVYHTDFAFFAAAAIVELICVVVVAPTYWRWWTLGRKVSFSPLEIAKAFESPLLEDCHSNSTGREIATAKGGTRIRYGVVASSDLAEKASRLAFADSSAVEKPRNGLLVDL